MTVLRLVHIKPIVAMAMAGLLVAALLAFGGLARASDHCDATVVAGGSIQDAVDDADPGGTICVEPGTYVENVMINKDVTLISTQGSEVTTIEGVDAGIELGAVYLTGATSAVQIGAPESGFTIIGLDGPPGLEKAGIYLQGSHDDTQILGNNVVADGDYALLTAFGATISGLVVSGNEFSGQTFEGDTPAGEGTGQQFTLPNVPRQVVTISGGSGGGNHSDVTFSDNLISATAGGINEDGNEQGNTLVTIDANGATITGNEFTGFTNRFANSLRTRGVDNEIAGNKLVAGSPVGLFIGGPASDTSTVNFNDIMGNGVGVLNDSSETLDATNNYWGHASGPGGPDGRTNPAGEIVGKGDAIVGPVDFDPWERRPFDHPSR